MRWILTLGLLWMLPVQKILATPPVSITLSYDMKASSLHVEAAHPSFNVGLSYVRLMEISVNGQRVKTLNYYQQNSPEKFWDDVLLKAKVGDVIKVDLYCTLGGTKSEELTVTKKGK